MTVRTPQENVDRVRNLISFVLVGSFVGALIDFTLFAVPPSNKDIITYMVGQLSGMALMALGFYFTNKVGQDAVDAKRAETTGKLADAMTAVTNASTSPAPKDAADAAGVVADAAVDAADKIQGGADPQGKGTTA